MKTKIRTAGVTVAFSAALICCGTGNAEDHGHKSNPVQVAGYNAYKNVVFVDPNKPGYLQVRTQGEGSLSHFGKLRSWSDDQQTDLATGKLTAHYTFENDTGDQLLMYGEGPSHLEPDGRVVFSGDFIILNGKGRFAGATGTLRFAGWARMTDYSTGEGIGFGTLEGVITGTKIKPDPRLDLDEAGSATFDGANFQYNGHGRASGVGRFGSEVRNTDGPWNGAFVGIVDGKFTLAWSFETTWTTRNGEQLEWTGIEFVYFDLLVLPGGSFAPDFSKPSFGDIYHTAEGGTGRFTGARGFLLAKAVFVPTSQTTIEAVLDGGGHLSRNEK